MSYLPPVISQLPGSFHVPTLQELATLPPLPSTQTLQAIPQRLGTYWPSMPHAQQPQQPQSEVVHGLETSFSRPPTDKNYAYLASPNPLRAAKETFVTQPADAAVAIYQTFTPEKVGDYRLARLDDTMRRAGSLGIATLATLGAVSRVIGIGEYVGMATWLAAMAITPKVINGIVQLKTGVNLNQEYVNTNRERQPFFQDPKYLPFRLFPDETIQKVGDRLGVPKDNPFRRDEIEERIRQISVQGRTWWMLMAGPATPIISGLATDRLEGPVGRLLNQGRTWLAERQLNASGGGDKAIQQFMHTQIGDSANARFSLWWQDFSRGLVQNAGLPQHINESQFSKLHQEGQLDLVAKQLESLNKTPEGRKRLQSTLNFLDKERQHIQGWEGQLLKALDSSAGKAGDKVIGAQREALKARMGSTLTTIGHYERLMQAIANGADTTQIRKHLKQNVIGEFQGLLESGRNLSARHSVGAGLYDKLTGLLRANRFGESFRQMGAYPGGHLLHSVRSELLHNVWRQRVGIAGGILLAATALYATLFIGRTPKSQTSSSREVTA